MDILYTPHTPRYYYLIFLILFFPGKFYIFSDGSYKTLPEYRQLELNDYVLITGFFPEFSYDILENKFSLQISINKLISNSFALYDNQLEKEIFKNKFFEEILKKNDAEKKQVLSEKKLVEEEKQKILEEVEVIKLEINSLDELISHQEDLLSICQEIYNYHQKEFNDGVISTIEFLQCKKDYLSVVYKHEELIFQKEVLVNEERTRRSQIPVSE